MSLPYINVRNHVLVTLDELATRGYAINPLDLARFSTLLPTRTKRIRFTRIPYTDDEVDLLEWIVILKGLGMTTPEVRQWLTTPSRDVVEARLQYVRRMVARADALLVTTPELTPSPTTRRPA